MKQKTKRLSRKFFSQNTKTVARQLLGKRIVRVLPSGEKLSGIITETEAYLGVKDKGCHSFGGRRTKRNEVMYGESGHIYVYFTYGMHWLLNIITSEVENPEGVLIRGVDKAEGPARLTKYLKIDKDFYGEDITRSERIWVENGIKINKSKIEELPRVGINYAEEWKDKLLRYKLP